MGQTTTKTKQRQCEVHPFFISTTAVHTVPHTIQIKFN